MPSVSVERAHLRGVSRQGRLARTPPKKKKKGDVLRGHNTVPAVAQVEKSEQDRPGIVVIVYRVYMFEDIPWSCSTGGLRVQLCWCCVRAGVLARNTAKPVAAICANWPGRSPWLSAPQKMPTL